MEDLLERCLVAWTKAAEVELPERDAGFLYQVVDSSGESARDARRDALQHGLELLDGFIADAQGGAILDDERPWREERSLLAGWAPHAASRSSARARISSERRQLSG